MKTIEFKNLILIVLLISCSGNKKLESDPILVQRLQRQVKSGQPILNLGQLTEFQWDSLLILTPYSQVDIIEKRLSIDLSKIKPSKIEFNDGINQLIFFHNGFAVKMIEYPRYPGDFDNEQNRIKFIRKDQATFDIIITDKKASDGRDWIELKKK